MSLERKTSDNIKMGGIQMTDQEINWEIAVALDHPHLRECARIGCCPSLSLIPNYSTDLNAIQEAVLSIGTQYWSQYNDVLMVVVDQGPPKEHMFSIYNATARQRAEAFLRTIGKWKEESK
jgi:hypothetical protein